MSIPHTPERRPRAKLTPNKGALPGNNEVESLDPQHQPGEHGRDTGSTTRQTGVPMFSMRGTSPSSGQRSPEPPVKAVWGYLRTEIQGFLATMVSDLQESLHGESDFLSFRADERMGKMQTAVLSQLHSSFSDFRDKQDKKEEKITSQLSTFNQGISTLQQSLHALTIAHQESYTLLQQGYEGLGHKINVIVFHDQEYARSLNESLQHHHNQMDTLVRLHLDMLSVGHQQPYRVPQDNYEKLEQKIDAVSRNDQWFARSVTEQIKKPHAQLSTLFKSHFETLSVSQQQSHTVFHQGNKELEKKIDAALHDRNKTLEKRTSAILYEDQGIAQTIAEGFKNYLARSYSELKQILDNFTALANEFTNFESLLHDFGTQMQVTQPGTDTEDSKILRRKRAD